jgi:NitT/TauT family transport system substrate-binding protein
MQAKGLRPLIDVGSAARDLGLGPETPLPGYVLDGTLVRKVPALNARFAAATRAAKDLLMTDDAAWDALRPRMKPADDADFIALRSGRRAGVPAPGPVNQAFAAAMLALMADLGGEQLVGRATTLPERVFASLP